MTEAIAAQVKADLASLPEDARTFILGGEFRTLATDAYNKAGGNITRETYVALREKFRAAIKDDVDASAFAQIDALTPEQKLALFHFASGGKETLDLEGFIKLSGSAIVEILKHSDASKFRVLAEHWKASA